MQRDRCVSTWQAKQSWSIGCVGLPGMSEKSLWPPCDSWPEPAP